MLEEALEAVTVYEKAQEQEQETVIDEDDILQTLLDKSAQRTTQNWIDYYTPSPLIIRALKEQNSNIQWEFTNWYYNNTYPDHNDNQIYRILLRIINEHSDQDRTPKATKIVPSGLEKLTSGVTDTASSFATNLVAPALLGDLYAKTTKQPEIQHTTATPNKRKQCTTGKKVMTLLDAPNMATRSMQPRTETEERQHRSTKEGTPQPPSSYPQKKPEKATEQPSKEKKHHKSPWYKNILKMTTITKEITQLASL